MPPLAASPRSDPASGAERHTVTNRCDKLLFSDVLNSDIIVGDGFPVPVILEQNHIHEVDQKVRIRLGANKNMTWYCTSSDLASLGHLPQRGRLLGFKLPSSHEPGGIQTLEHSTNAQRRERVRGAALKSSGAVEKQET